jgi:hypothetical protein
MHCDMLPNFTRNEVNGSEEQSRSVCPNPAFTDIWEAFTDAWYRRSRNPP